MRVTKKQAMRMKRSTEFHSQKTQMEIALTKSCVTFAFPRAKRRVNTEALFWNSCRRKDSTTLPGAKISDVLFTYNLATHRPMHCACACVERWDGGEVNSL